jgi:hypothetical protein
VKFLMILAMLILISASPAWAGCKSDCQDDYQSEVESCRTNYDDPDDADELKICMDNAKSEYDSCVNDCED